MTLPRAAARHPDAATPDHKLALVLAFVFGVVFLAALLVLAVAIPDPTPSQFEIFRIVIALAAGGVAAVIPGLLDLRLKQGARFVLRAGGALAVFVVVYFYSPARWVTDTAPASVKADHGVAAGHDLSMGGGTITIAPPPAGPARLDASAPPGTGH